METPDPPTPPSRSQPAAALLDAVFDLSFTTPITPRIVKWLYIISIIASALVAVSSIIAGFSVGIMAGLLAMLVAPVLFVVYILAARVALEVVMAVFQIADSLKKR